MVNRIVRKTIYYKLLKAIIIPLITIVLALGCSKEIKDGPCIISTRVDINILNQDGEDLLNPEIPGYFPFEDMKLYYLIKGEKIEVAVFDPQTGGDGGIFLITEIDPYILAILTYSHGDEGFTHENNGYKIGTAIAYLELNENDTDTIITEWASKDCYFGNNKVWYNGELQAMNSVFQVVKTN